jgi:hypothetical protein
MSESVEISPDAHGPAAKDLKTRVINAYFVSEHYEKITVASDLAPLLAIIGRLV